MAIIYKTTNLINGKYYVGKHNTSADDGYLGSGVVLKQAISKYGKDNFKRDILEHCSDSDINERERYWISELSACDVGYNLSVGGDGGDLSMFMTDEGRERIRKASTGRKHSEESKKLISEVRLKTNGARGKVPWNKGKTTPDDIKKKIGDANRGRVLSQEHKNKISKSNIGKLKPKTKEHREKISRTLMGRKLSESVCIKMSESRRGIPQKKIQCPHCGKWGGVTMYRWHFDNCKYKNG